MTLQANTDKAAAAASAVVERAARDERTRFKRHFPMLILEEETDAWGRPRFRYPHVESMFAGWDAGVQIGRAEVGDADDSVRLNFLASHGAFVSWSQDRRSCAVFRNDDEGNLEPMTGWDGSWSTAREAIDAAIEALQGEGVAA